MNTPICDYVRAYAASSPVRLHMPGHKGMALLGMEERDITEIEGADVLYQAEGIIRQSEKNAETLFETARTIYSTEGSTLGIRAMLYLSSLYAAQNGKKTRILAARNAHRAFITGAALLNIDVDWLFPEAMDSVIACRLTAEALEKRLSGMAELPTAVYVTSPDYLGNVADVRALAEVCHRRGILLLVDNAHGAYLQFLPEKRHPMALGADLCCDSAHKTLPVLTGGAYLHVSHAAPQMCAEAAEQAMALFASTSPSYLIMQSLDRANAYMADGYRERLAKAVDVWAAVKAELIAYGYEFAGDEPMKLTFMPKSYGYTGTMLAGILEKQNIVCEFSDPDYLVMMISPEFDDSVPKRLLAALKAVPRRAAIEGGAPKLTKPEAVIPPGRAIFMKNIQVNAAEAEGRIMASACVSCPPAIPIVSIGERIDEAAVQAMAYYGINRIQVIDE